MNAARHPPHPHPLPRLPGGGWTPPAGVTVHGVYVDGDIVTAALVACGLVMAWVVLSWAPVRAARRRIGVSTAIGAAASAGGVLYEDHLHHAALAAAAGGQLPLELRVTWLAGTLLAAAVLTGGATWVLRARARGRLRLRLRRRRGAAVRLPAARPPGPPPAGMPRPILSALDEEWNNS